MKNLERHNLRTERNTVQIQKPTGVAVCDNSSTLIHASKQRRPSVTHDPNLPPGWKACIDGKGRKYYWHQASNKTQWNPPILNAVEIESKERFSDEEILPDKACPPRPSSTVSTPTSSTSLDEWKEAVDPKSGKTYYYNPNRRQTTWVKPTSDCSNTEWVDITDEHTGARYYFNTKTKLTSWKKPEQKSDWTKCKDKDNREYYYNTITMETSWSLPEGVAAQSVLASSTITDKRVSGAESSRQSRVSTSDSCFSSDEPTWIEQTDPQTGKVYYYDPRTRQAVWELPRGESIDRPSPPPANTDSNDDWKALVDPNTKKTYYYSASRRETTWEKPTLPTKQESEELPNISILNDHVSDSSVFQDYAYKQGGGTRFFGRQNWKRRFFVIVDRQMGVFRSRGDYETGQDPIKSRWVDLTEYRLEEMLSDELGFRLLPAEVMSSEQRVWNLKATNLNQKQAWIRVLHDSVGGQGFVKSLDKALSEIKLKRTQHN